MARVVAQGRCPSPRCGSSDAYTEYDDGGYHCFSCGLHGAGNVYKKLAKALAQSKVPLEDSVCPPMPLDSDTELPARVLQWIKKYGLTDAEIDENEMLYSPSESLLIFPVRDYKGKLLMWQGRNFSNKLRVPKYITRRPKDSVVMHIIGEQKGKMIVLTEDLISAIKVGRQCSTMPLWGSHISSSIAKILSTHFESAVIWLDCDKRDYAIRAAMQHCLFFPIVPLITSLDPKEYSDDEIQEILND